MNPSTFELLKLGGMRATGEISDAVYEECAAWTREYERIFLEFHPDGRPCSREGCLCRSSLTVAHIQASELHLVRDVMRESARIAGAL